MNQFSSVDELNMAIAGNRREGRRNKSLLSEYMPSLPVTTSVSGHHHLPGSLMSPSSSVAAHHHQHQQQQQQQQQHYANVLAADDRFRNLAAAIIDNRHRSTEHIRQQSTSRPGSPHRLSVQLQSQAGSVMTDASPFNSHLQPPPYQSASMAIAGDQTNKQRGKISVTVIVIVIPNCISWNQNAIDK